MGNAFDVVMATPLPGGVRLGLRFGEEGLQEAEWLPAQTPLRQPHDAKQRETVEQISAFWRDGRAQFQLPLDLHGTPFQRRVWQAMLAIPPGQVRSYGELARQLHSSARAVGNACRANPIPLIVPCHRIVSANGLGGYMGAFSGAPLSIKEWLLKHEGAL